MRCSSDFAISQYYTLSADCEDFEYLLGATIYQRFLNCLDVLRIIGHDQLLAKHAQFHCVVMLFQKVLIPYMELVASECFEHSEE